MKIPSLVAVAAAFAFSAEIDRGRLQSDLIGKELDYIVVKPDGYSQAASQGRQFPVVYLLHCAGCRADSWLEADGARVDRLVDEYGLILVLVDDGDVLGWWLDSPVNPQSQFSSYLVEELKPHIDSSYSVSPDPRATGLAGHSMGGFGALYNLIEHPDVFHAAFSAKGAVDLMPYPERYGLSEVLGSQATSTDNWRGVNIVDQICRLKDSAVHIQFYSGPNDWFNGDNILLHRTMDSCGVEHKYFTTEEHHFKVPEPMMKRMLDFFDSVLVVADQGSPVLPGESRLAAQNDGAHWAIDGHWWGFWAGIAEPRNILGRVAPRPVAHP